MKQLILIERSELATLKAGATLNLTIAGQGVLIGLEGRKALAKVSTRTNTRRRTGVWRCHETQCKSLKPFKNQSDYMKHRRATHQQEVRAKKAR